MGDGADDGDVAAEDSLNTGAATSAVSPSSLRVQGRAVAAEEARIACHGARPK
jgi:hypothetical protein